MDELLIREEESKILHSIIKKLKPNEQFIIRSIYFEGMKQKDVAEILGLNRCYMSVKHSKILKKCEQCIFAKNSKDSGLLINPKRASLITTLVKSLERK